MDSFHNDSEQALRNSVKRKMIISAIMCATLVLIPVVVFFVQNSLSMDLMLILLIPFALIGILGAILLVYYKMGSSMLFYSMDILRQIAPPEPFIEGKFAVLNKDPVYCIAQWGSNALFFVALNQPERTFDQKVKVPRAIWKWEYTRPIGKIKVARREGNFTIPVDRDTYCTGSGILYSLLLEKTVLVTYLKKFTDEQLNQIVDNLAREIVSYGSRRQADGGDFE